MNEISSRTASIRIWRALPSGSIHWMSTCSWSRPGAAAGNSSPRTASAKRRPAPRGGPATSSAWGIRPAAAAARK